MMRIVNVCSNSDYLAYMRIGPRSLAMCLLLPRSLDLYINKYRLMYKIEMLKS